MQFDEVGLFNFIIIKLYLMGGDWSNADISVSEVSTELQ